MNGRETFPAILRLALLGFLGFATLSSQAQEPRGPKVDEGMARPDLAQELLQRMEEDQAARQLWVEWMRQTEGKLSSSMHAEFESITTKVKAIDDRNRTWLAETIDKVGWPGKSLVGERAAHAAWLLVQHADADLEFQEKCLERMKAMPAVEVAPVDIAYLTDRVLVGRSRPQVYGTQCHEVEGRFVPRECVDPDRLDERRREVGLMPIQEYLEQMEAIYRPSDKTLDQEKK